MTSLTLYPVEVELFSTTVKFVLKSATFSKPFHPMVGNFLGKKLLFGMNLYNLALRLKPKRLRYVQTQLSIRELLE